MPGRSPPNDAGRNVCKQRCYRSIIHRIYERLRLQSVQTRFGGVSVYRPDRVVTVRSVGSPTGTYPAWLATLNVPWPVISDDTTSITSRTDNPNFRLLRASRPWSSSTRRAFVAPWPSYAVLTKDLLRVSRAGGGYHLQFADADAERLAARVLGIYQGHVGESREMLETALADVEQEADDFKLVRGLAKLVEREATFETQAPIDPVRARRRVFEAASDVGVVTEAEREQALAEAADHFGTDAASLADTLYADRALDRSLLRWTLAGGRPNCGRSTTSR